MGVLVFILGLCCGSFVNMLGYRTAEKYKLIGKSKNKRRNRSFCDFCGKKLSWGENVPVISWLIQGGKSRCCGKRLPLSYPIVELITALLLTLNFQFSILNSQNLFLLGLESLVITMLVFAASFDIKYMILPDFSIGVLAVAAGTRLLLGFGWDYVMMAAAGAGFLLVLYWLTKGKGMGLGDVKLALFMGLWLGWPRTVVAFYVAFVVGAVVGGALMLAKKLKRKSLIAFGPFLILGTLAAWWWGEALLGIFNLQFSIYK